MMTGTCCMIFSSACPCLHVKVSCLIPFYWFIGWINSHLAWPNSRLMFLIIHFLSLQEIMECNSSNVQMSRCAKGSETTIETKIKTLDSQIYNLCVNKYVSWQCMLISQTMVRSCSLGTHDVFFELFVYFSLVLCKNLVVSMQFLFTINLIPATFSSFSQKNYCCILIWQEIYI